MADGEDSESDEIVGRLGGGVDPIAVVAPVGARKRKRHPINVSSEGELCIAFVIGTDCPKLAGGDILNKHSPLAF